MSWAVGWDSTWQRDVGYGVPAKCDWPGCGADIDRGLAYVCGGQPFGGEDGCGLYFCLEHGGGYTECTHGGGEIGPTPDVPEWIMHKLTDSSWAAWRADNPEWVLQARQAVKS